MGEEERESIPQDVRKLFEPRKMYEEALSKDIPWRKWNAWLKHEIIKCLEKYETPVNATTTTETKPKRIRSRSSSSGKSPKGESIFENKNASKADVQGAMFVEMFNNIVLKKVNVVQQITDETDLSELCHKMFTRFQEQGST